MEANVSCGFGKWESGGMGLSVISWQTFVYIYLCVCVCVCVRACVRACVREREREREGVRERGSERERSDTNLGLYRKTENIDKSILDKTQIK